MTMDAEQPTTAPTSRVSTISGFSIAPPIIGRISIGHLTLHLTRNTAKKRPMADNSFQITSLVRNDDLSWQNHPMMDELTRKLELKEPDAESAQARLQRIPVRIAYNSLDLNLQNQYACFDEMGRPSCIGNGEKAKRLNDGLHTEVECRGPDACAYGRQAKCQSHSRIFVRIEGQSDLLGVFAFRTHSFNTLNYIGARLTQLHNALGGQIAGIPFDLVIRTKTSVASFGQPFSFVDLEERHGQTLFQAIAEGKSWRDLLSNSGFDIDRSEQGLIEAQKNSAFALSDDDFDALEGLADLSGEEAIKATLLPGLSAFAAQNKAPHANEEASSEPPVNSAALVAPVSELPAEESVAPPVLASVEVPPQPPLPDPAPLSDRVPVSDKEATQKKVAKNAGTRTPRSPATVSPVMTTGRTTPVVARQQTTLAIPANRTGFVKGAVDVKSTKQAI